MRTSNLAFALSFALLAACTGVVTGTGSDGPEDGDAPGEPVPASDKNSAREPETETDPSAPITEDEKAPPTQSNCDKTLNKGTFAFSTTDALMQPGSIAAS